MSGAELKSIADRADLKPVMVCGAASISINTLYKVYNGEHVSAKTLMRVEAAITSLAAKKTVSVAG